MLQTSVASTAPFSQHSGHGNTLLGALPEEERALWISSAFWYLGHSGRLYCNPQSSIAKARKDRDGVIRGKFKVRIMGT